MAFHSMVLFAVGNYFQLAAGLLMLHQFLTHKVTGIVKDSQMLYAGGILARVLFSLIPPVVWSDYDWLSTLATWIDLAANAYVWILIVRTVPGWNDSHVPKIFSATSIAGCAFLLSSIVWVYNAMGVPMSNAPVFGQLISFTLWVEALAIVPQLLVTRKWRFDRHRVQKLPKFIYWFIGLISVSRILHMTFWVILFTVDEENHFVGMHTLWGEMRTFEFYSYIIPDLVAVILTCEYIHQLHQNSLVKIIQEPNKMLELV